MSELDAIELAEKRERTKPEPGEGFEYCSREEAVDVSFFNDGAMLWRPWERLGVEHCGKPDNYVYRRPKQSAPKLPTVKAPEGTRWEIHPPLGMCLARKSGSSTYLDQVPVDVAARDRLAACVAAFDEVNGIPVFKLNSAPVSWRQCQYQNRRNWVEMRVEFVFDCSDKESTAISQFLESCRAISLTMGRKL